MSNRTKYNQEYYLRNKEKISQQHKDWKKNNPEKYLEMRNRYNRANKEKVAMWQKKYRLKLKNEKNEKSN